MRTALLLGVPAGYVATAKSAIAKNAALFSAWSIKYIPSDRKEAEILEGMIRHAQEVADRYEEPHVLGFSAQKGRQRLADQIKPYFRFRWFDHLLLKCLGSPDPTAFVEKLASDLAEECEWAVRVKPSNTNSPLLLPESSFEPTRRHRDLWRHASAYGDLQNIAGAENAIKGFRSAHYRRVNFKSFGSTSKWVDERDRIYDQDGPKHAVAPFPRGWKYSYRIEPGFHFDVTQLNGRQFDLIDVDGRVNRVNAGDYLNVDPHGYVRR